MWHSVSDGADRVSAADIAGRTAARVCVRDRMRATPSCLPRCKRHQGAAWAHTCQCGHGRLAATPFLLFR
jgi:hypothetical protein